MFALGIPLQREGPQSGTRARFNPIHAMFRDGGDRPKTPEEVKEAQGYGGSDDWIVMPLQCVTQWDSLAHIFYEGKMWNGYDADLVTSTGAAKNSIDKTNEQAGRARRAAGRGRATRACARSSRATPSPWPISKPRPPRRRSRCKRGDLLLVRTGHMTRYLDKKRLAPLRPRRLPRHVDPHDAVAARQADRGHRLRQLRGGGPARRRCRPSATPSTWCAIPNMGLTLGEIFFLEELAADCAADGR